MATGAIKPTGSGRNIARVGSSCSRKFILIRGRRHRTRGKEPRRSGRNVGGLHMNRFLWTQSLTETLCPPLPCPVCKQGALSLVQKSLIAKETIQSKRARNDSDWD